MNDIAVFFVYDHPIDYPDGFVVRRWRVQEGDLRPEEDLFARGASLDAVRAQLPQGVKRLPAAPGDEEGVIEFWL